MKFLQVTFAVFPYLVLIGAHVYYWLKVRAIEEKYININKELYKMYDERVSIFEKEVEKMSLEITNRDKIIKAMLVDARN